MPTQVREEVAFKCPFCGGSVSAGYAGGNEVPVVLHSQPACKQFIEEPDPIAFMKACNDRRYVQC